MPGFADVRRDSLTMDTVLWLLRHPEPEASASGRCYGSLDVKLSENGAGQARAVAAMLAGEPLDAIYTSPRLRCTQAANIVAGGRPCPVIALDALRELDFGEFEGRTYDEIAAHYPELYRQWMEDPTSVEFPSGESFVRMRTRVLAAMSDLLGRHAGECIAIVTHGGAARIILADCLGIPRENLFRIGQRYAGVNRIRYVDGFPIVELMNAAVNS
jgi:alpha-ribazole phosphatase/probable phosphoglycerate mutase